MNSAYNFNLQIKGHCS